MSVTFSATTGSLKGWDVTCVCGARYLQEGDTPMSYETASQLVALKRAQGTGFVDCADEDCFTFGLFTSGVYEGEEGPHINMSNINSVAVLEALGIKSAADEFSEVCCGALQAEDFKGRVLMALAVAPTSAERLTEVRTAESGATMVHCGIEEGYVQHRLEALLEVADFALAQDREVTWN